MKRCLLFLACAALLTAAPAFAQFIWIDCSFKAVLSPDTGGRYYAFTAADIDATLDQANEYLDRYLRGYRLRRVGLLYDIGAKGDTNGPSNWYCMNPGEPWAGDAGQPTTNDWQWHMDQVAKTNSLYHWNSNAINFYVLGCPARERTMRAASLWASLGERVRRPRPILSRCAPVHMPLVLLHEIGHWFSLMHTHGNCILPQPPTAPPVYGLARIQTTVPSSRMAIISASRLSGTPSQCNRATIASPTGI